MSRTMLAHLETCWQEPDEGIWEVRGPRRHFVHSKVMAWVAFDRGVRAVDEFGLDGPVERWRGLRATIFEEVCTRGFNPERGAFTQSYGSTELDASLLRLPLVGFLPADDARVRGTVAAIERELVEHGLVRRYAPSAEVEGLLPTREGAFLVCTAWLGEVYARGGRRDEARAVLDRLAGIANDVGLLAEEYDPVARRQLGNFPQAFSHLGLVGLALALQGSARAPSATGRPL
jgi:GH15 family glucan-1,4-alpha-glucosidase